jgi:hypothetical protein
MGNKEYRDMLANKEKARLSMVRGEGQGVNYKVQEYGYQHYRPGPHFFYSLSVLF